LTAAEQASKAGVRGKPDDVIGRLADYADARRSVGPERGSIHEKSVRYWLLYCAGSGAGGHGRKDFGDVGHLP
jgi:hypothetical protein